MWVVGVGGLGVGDEGGGVGAGGVVSDACCVVFVVCGVK